MNIPNLITFSRLVLIIPFIYLLEQPFLLSQWLAFFLFLIASLTDWLDGYLARKLDQITDLGKFLDPLTDKMLVIAPLLVLVEKQILPAWSVLLIILREMAIAGWRVNPQQQQISGANIWGKLKTVFQISAIAFLIIPLSSPPYIKTIGLIIFSLAVILTIVSGLIYLIPQQEN